MNQPFVFKKLKTNKPCGNHQCGVSSGICGHLTFGSGKLDMNGYWEFDCIPCEDAYLRSQGIVLEPQVDYQETLDKF